MLTPVTQTLNILTCYGIMEGYRQMSDKELENIYEILNDITDAIDKIWEAINELNERIDEME